MVAQITLQMLFTRHKTTVSIVKRLDIFDNIASNFNMVMPIISYIELSNSTMVIVLECEAIFLRSRHIFGEFISVFYYVDIHHARWHYGLSLRLLWGSTIFGSRRYNTYLLSMRSVSYLDCR